ncbi:MAG: AAA-like domain-containing protein [Acidobacteria bacterium]|nr:AAA-like domain-containing protein [Acidobacteriota bacterium]
MIYTFYSFKGGVGRTMALANIAEILYRHGLNVLMVDFDLEAPGLERFFNVSTSIHKPNDVMGKRGIIDLLYSYKELRSLPRPSQPLPTESEVRQSPDLFPFQVEPLSNFIVRIYRRSRNRGTLSLIPAGLRKGDEFTNYARRVRSFDWDDFYVNWDGEQFFEWFRRETEKLADVVLIDSRTGVTEMSGVCTYQLADIVLMFVAPNQQNLDGISMMAHSLSNSKLITEGRNRRPLSLLVIPSRVEHSEAELLDKFADQFDQMLGTLPFFTLEFEKNAFIDLKIPYVPYYAYMENVAVREPERASAADMIKAYERISATIAQLEPPAGPLRKLYRKRFRIFISYSSSAEPDRSVALQILEALQQREDCEVFIDQMIPVGVVWAEYLRGELERADFLIALLSQNSVRSDMFREEVQMAHELARERNGRPAILPVRLAFKGSLPYSLAAYLDRIQWASWENSEDTSRLIEQITQSITGQPLSISELQSKSWLIQPSEVLLPPQPSSAQPIRLEMAEGTVPPQSIFYVTRLTDHIALEAIQRQGVTITIKGPRQIGKSSLLMRTIEQAIRIGKRVTVLDFQLFDQSVLANADLLYRRFCEMVTDELEIESRVEEYWDSPLGNSQRCTRYISRYILRELDVPLVIAMDEVDMLFDTNFRSDFFSMLRSWHNSRANIATKIWKQLDLILVTSTEPYQLIENLNQSPFNVGEVINLEDFTSTEVSDLNLRHGSPFNDKEEKELMQLTNGHPYLVRRALYMVASGRISAAGLFTEAKSDQGPFGDHLRHHLFRVHDKHDLIDSLCEVLKRNTCQDETTFFRLRGAGLVRREGGGVRPRCQLYADFFMEHLKCQER